MSRRPNILHLFTDQQRFDTINALGNPLIKTPGLDRLAREGTAFVKAYTPSPVCVPARASLHVGRYPWRTGCYDNGDPWPDETAPAIPSVLGQAGYRTHAIGKCHFQPDLYALRGFQSRETMEELVEKPEKDDYLRYLRENHCGQVQDLHGLRGDFYYLPQPGQLPEGMHPTAWVGQRSAAFIKEQAGEKEPWYLYGSFIHPHPPWVLPPKWSKLYRSNEMPAPFLPENRDELITFVNHFQNRYKWRDRGLDYNLLRAQRAFYYGCVSFIDRQIKNLLELLERLGQLDNTLIVFSSDHGEYLGDYGCYGKRGMHDVACRIPLLARWPSAFPAGMINQNAASLVDLLPTFAAAAGVPVESDGQDLSQLPADGERIVFSQYQKGNDALYMAADRQAKYIYSASDDAEFLFRHAPDGREEHNVVRDPAAAHLLSRLREALLREIGPFEEGRGLKKGTWTSYPRRQMPSDPDEGLLFQDQPFSDLRLPHYQDDPSIRTES